MNWLKRLLGNNSPKTKPSPTFNVETPTSINAQQTSLPPTKPAVFLTPVRENHFSKLGGLPFVPPDFEWPTWKGKPQSFLAQLDLSEISQTQKSFLPSAGYLYFFYDQDQGVWGFDSKDLGGWKVLYKESAIETFAEYPAPEGLKEEHIYKTKPIAPKLIETIPDAQLLPIYPNGEDEEWDAYEAKRSAPFENKPRHQMFGYCSAVQNAEMDVECELIANGLYLGDTSGYKDPRVPELRKNAHEWKLLLQLDTDDDTGWMWGDVGMLYFWIRESDAQAKDFSKVWMIFQCS